MAAQVQTRAPALAQSEMLRDREWWLRHRTTPCAARPRGSACDRGTGCDGGERRGTRECESAAWGDAGWDRASGCEGGDEGGATADDVFRLGLVSERGAGDVEGARRAYERALDLDPSHCPSLRNLVRLMHHHFEEDEEARRLYERCLILRPDDDQIHSGMATILQGRFGENEAARAHFERAIELDPSNSSSHHLFGVFLLLRCGCEGRREGDGDGGRTHGGDDDP